MSDETKKLEPIDEVIKDLIRQVDKRFKVLQVLSRQDGELYRDRLDITIKLIYTTSENDSFKTLSRDEKLKILYTINAVNHLQLKRSLRDLKNMLEEDINNSEIA